MAGLPSPEAIYYIIQTFWSLSPGPLSVFSPCVCMLLLSFPATLSPSPWQLPWCHVLEPVTPNSTQRHFPINLPLYTPIWLEYSFHLNRIIYYSNFSELIFPLPWETLHPVSLSSRLGMIQNMEWSACGGNLENLSETWVGEKLPLLQATGIYGLLVSTAKSRQCWLSQYLWTLSHSLKDCSNL